MAPARFCNSLSFGHKYSVCINSLFISHIAPSFCGQQMTQSSLSPISASHHCSPSLQSSTGSVSAHHHCSPFLHPVFHGCPGTSIPSLAPTPWRAVETSKASPTSLSEANSFCKLTCRTFSHSLEGTGTDVPNPQGQHRLSRDRQFSLREQGGLWWDPPSLTISCSKGLTRSMNISGAFQRGFPSCHLVDKGDIFPFYFTEGEKEHLGKLIFGGESGWAPSQINFMCWETWSCDIPYPGASPTPPRH